MYKLTSVAITLLLIVATTLPVFAESESAVATFENIGNGVKLGTAAAGAGAILAAPFILWDLIKIAGDIVDSHTSYQEPADVFNAKKYFNEKGPPLVDEWAE